MVAWHRRVLRLPFERPEDIEAFVLALIRSRHTVTIHPPRKNGGNI